MFTTSRKVPAVVSPHAPTAASQRHPQSNVDEKQTNVTVYINSPCLKGGVTDHQLDAAELQFAMDELHERLNAKAGGKLPAIEEKAEKLLKKFDEGKGGRGWIHSKTLFNTLV
jgi:hypothetical protein